VTIAGIFNLDKYWIAGEQHRFELPEGADRPRPKNDGTDVYGCGLVLDPEDKVAIFFTLNGQLLGELMLLVLRINKRNNSQF
jgi:hypothetical protein